MKILLSVAKNDHIINGRLRTSAYFGQTSGFVLSIFIFSIKFSLGSGYLCVYHSLFIFKLKIKTMTGKVKFFNDKKGWGFIKENDCDAEWFVHFSNTKDKITDDDPVEFDEGVDRNGKPIAVNVKRIKSDENKR
jgi:CspA family cold shock protein